MSNVIARKLLELQVNALSAGFSTAFENAPFTPVDGTAWQRVNIMWGQTENPTLGDGFKREVGVLQLLLHFPRNAGPSAAETRAEVLKAGFKRGSSFTEGSVRVLVDRSPHQSSALPPDDKWFRLAVSVPFVVDVQP